MSSIGYWTLNPDTGMLEYVHGSSNEQPNINIGLGFDENIWDDFNQEVPTDEVEKIKQKQNNCWHEWAEYEGIRFKYKYCVKCDAKRDIQ